MGREAEVEISEIGKIPHRPRASEVPCFSSQRLNWPTSRTQPYLTKCISIHRLELPHTPLHPSPHLSSWIILTSLFDKVVPIDIELRVDVVLIDVEIICCRNVQSLCCGDVELL